MKGNCNIAKDLLPLYLEELCSADSREYVAEHLKHCRDCTATYEYLKYTDLCISATEKKEINAFKKLERYISGKILINYFLFLVAIVTGILILAFNTNTASLTTYYLLMPLTILATGFTFSHPPFRNHQVKASKLRFIVQGVLLLYSIILMFYAMHATLWGTLPFGLQPHDVGSLLSIQFKIVLSISLFFFISHLYQVGRKKSQYSIWWNVSILCIFLNLTYDSTLYHMESPQTLMKVLIASTAILLAIAVITSLFIWIVLVRKKRKMKDG